MVQISFKNQNCSICVEEGTTILEAARKANVIVESPYDGMGTCGKCKVWIGADQKDAVTCPEVSGRLTKEEADAGYVLACQAKVKKDLVVEFESTEKQNKTLKILNEGITFKYENEPYIRKEFDGEYTIIYGGDEVLGKETGDTTGHLYGLSIDIGTTTVVCALIDMRTGKELGSTSALNPQSLHAQDVLTRIKFASDPDGLKLMYESIIAEFNKMVKTLCSQYNIQKEWIYEAVYSGNTTMIHLAGNRNPKSLGKFPYTPVLKGGCYGKASENGILISPFGLVYYPPIISAYVGPDITSGVLSTCLKDKKGTTLLIDIGTNGEMVIGKDGALSATSTAAGPAFEGMNITFGMRAGKGAIEYFEVLDNHEIEYRTIGNQKAEGICGSGLFDIVGELVRVGIIKKNGRFLTPDKLAEKDPLKAHLKEYEGKLAFEIADGIFLILKDIRQVQLAKGAVRSGVEALMKSQNVEAGQVDQVLIAGSFGYHLRAKSLVNLALLPAEFLDKIEFVGNTSKTGGNAFLLNRDFREEMKDLVEQIQCVELANIDGFNDLFVKCLNF